MHEQERRVDDRVLAVYMGGDNNLSSECDAKLAALREGFASVCAASASARLRMVVYRDMLGAAPSLCEVTSNGELSPIESYEEESSASPEVFGRVLRQVCSLFPARGYTLLVFSHASGWLPEGRLAAPVGPDDEVHTRTIVADGASEMELADFASAIPRGMFDGIIFETCFMAGIEAAWELRDKCDFMLASSAEIVSPGFTHHYRTLLGHLFGPPSGLADFGQAVVDSLCVYPASDWRRSATYSLIRASTLAPLAEFIRTRCDAALAVSVFDVQRFDRGTHRLFFDMGDYYSRMLDSEADRVELQRLIAAAVPWKAATDSFLYGQGGFAVERHSGLTAYIRQSAYPYLNMRYDGLGWAKAVRKKIPQ
jgi:hypothetical protein